MRRRAALPALAVALLLALTSCSIVPTSSPTVPITQAPERPIPDVVFEPPLPRAGASPEEIVRGFIDAAASRVRGRPVAVEYLTPDAARAWSDTAGITIIRPGFATVASEGGSVEVTADLVGAVDARGVFTVAGGDPFTHTFKMLEVDGQWRIAGPPVGLVILLPDFERLYDPVAAYFFDPLLQELVPDPRYLIGGEAQPTALVERLIEGPSPGLGPLGVAPVVAVRNPLAGARLARTVTVEEQTARVDLTDLVVEPGTPLREICAQVVWTLTQLEDLGIRSVEITVDGEPLPLEGVPAEQTTDDWQDFDPDASPLQTVGHYLDAAGALRTVTEGLPAPGPATGLSSAAVVADDRTGDLAFTVGVRPEPGGGSTLLAGLYGGELGPVPGLGVRTFSAPTVAAHRQEVWVVRDGTEIVRVPLRDLPRPVSTPSLPSLGRAQSIELSPDGVRVAVIVAGPRGPQLHVGTVVRSEGEEVEIRDFSAVAPTVSPVIDVAWRSSSELWVLAGDQGDETPYSLGVDGWGLTALTEGTSGLPAGPDSLAAAPGRRPLVVSGGTLWQWSNEAWVTLVRGQEPLRGTAPFYPR